MEGVEVIFVFLKGNRREDNFLSRLHFFVFGYSTFNLPPKGNTSRLVTLQAPLTVELLFNFWEEKSRYISRGL